MILPDEEVSTTIGTLYSISFGMTASVRLEPQAPIITGTLSRGDQLLGDCRGFGRVALVVLDDELDLLAEHAALGVDLVGGDLGAVDDVGAGGGERRRSAAGLTPILMSCAAALPAQAA